MIERYAPSSVITVSEPLYGVAFFCGAVVKVILQNHHNPEHTHD